MRRRLTAGVAVFAAWLTLAAAAAGAVPTATLLPSGRAIPPPSAPPAIKAMIRAANRIRHRPYLWGGGHANWQAPGYDCSGSISYVLHGAGLLQTPMDSTEFMSWGKPGASPWVQIYANREHVFAVIDGLRWDTVPPTANPRGPGWSTEMVSTRGFTLRHPSRFGAAGEAATPAPEPVPPTGEGPAQTGNVPEGAGRPAASSGGVSPLFP